MSRLITTPLLICIGICICFATSAPALWAEESKDEELTFTTHRVIDPALRGVWYGLAMSTDQGETITPENEEFAVLSALRFDPIDTTIAAWDLQQAIHIVNSRGEVKAWVLQFRQQTQIAVTRPGPGLLLAQFYNDHGLDENTNPETFRVVFVVRR